MSDVIEIKNLSKNFSKLSAIKNLSFNVPSSGIFALLGPNGAGKSTLIKVLVNIIKADSGTINILGHDSLQLGPDEYSRIGYVSEDQDVPDWMTLKQLIDYCQSLYPNWDEKFCSHLTEQFDLRIDEKIKNYSKGMRMKAILLCALAHRPQLLVLDEPFSGFDPGVKQELVSGVLDITENEGWTVFISSHDIQEVERLADRVCILNEGQLVFCEKMDELQENQRLIEVFTEAPVLLEALILPKSWKVLKQQGRMLKILDHAYQEGSCQEKVTAIFGPASSHNVKTLKLNEIFLYATQKPNRLNIKGGTK